jgi:hypothetical protein
MVPIFIRRKIKLSEIRNFIFESTFFDIIRPKEEITAEIMNAYIIYVEIRNTTNRSIIINRKKHLGSIEKYGIERYYLITEKSWFLVIERMLWVRKILTMDVLASTAANLAIISQNSITTMIEINIKEIIIDFGITVYESITIR